MFRFERRWRQVPETGVPSKLRVALVEMLDSSSMISASRAGLSRSAESRPRRKSLHSGTIGSDIVGRQDLALGHLPAGLVDLDLPVGSVEAVGRVAQEDHPSTGMK